MANNLARLIADLQDYGDDVVEKAERGVAETAMLIDTQASSNAPVDDGNLKNSILADVNGLEASVTVGAFYGVYVEFGTGIHSTKGSRAKQIPWTYYKDGRFYTTYGMVAQPFWHPALDVGARYFKKYFGR